MKSFSSQSVRELDPIRDLTKPIVEMGRKGYRNLSCVEPCISRLEMRKVVSAVFSCLNREERRVTAMLYLDGMSVAKVAETRKMDIYRVKRTRKNAIRKIQNCPDLLDTLRPLLAVHWVH